MFRILADVNVPEEYVSALRGDGHDVAYTREIHPGERVQGHDWDAVADQAEEAYPRTIDGSW